MKHFRFTDAQGRLQRVDYVADEFGYRVSKPAEEKIVLSEAAITVAAEPVVEEIAPVAETAAAPASPVEAAGIEPVSVAGTEVTAADSAIEEVASVVAAVPASSLEVAVVENPVGVAEKTSAADPVKEEVVPVAEVAAAPISALEPASIDPGQEAAAPSVADPLVVAPVDEIVSAPAAEIKNPIEPVVAAADPVVVEVVPVAEVADASTLVVESAIIDLGQEAAVPFVADPVVEVAVPVDEIVSALEAELETPIDPVVAAADPIVVAEISAAPVLPIEDPLEPREPVPAEVPIVAVPVAEPVSVEAEQKSSAEIKPKLIALSVSAAYPGPAYFRGSLPYAQPVFHYSPYPYAYGYGIGYPYETNYIYGL